MKTMIKYYINLLKEDDILKFASSKGIVLSDDELNFTYNFIKENGANIVENPDSFNIDEYRKKFSEENFKKVQDLIKEYINYL